MQGIVGCRDLGMPRLGIVIKNCKYYQSRVLYILLILDKVHMSFLESTSNWRGDPVLYLF